MINLPNIGTGIGLYAAYKTGTRAPAHYLGYGVAGYAAGWLALRYTGAKEAAYAGPAFPICAVKPELPQCKAAVQRGSRQGFRLSSHQPRRTAYGSYWTKALEGIGGGVRLPEGCTEGNDRCKPQQYWSKTTGRPCTKWHPWMAMASMAACPDNKQTLAHTVMAQRLVLGLGLGHLKILGYTPEAIRYMKASFERNKRTYADMSGASEARLLAAAMAAADAQESMVPSLPVPAREMPIESRRDRMLHELDRPFDTISDNEILAPMFRACASGRDLSTFHHDIQEGCEGMRAIGVTPATMTRMAQDVESGLPKLSAAAILAFKRDVGLAPAAEVSEVSKAGAMTIDGKAVPTWALAAGAGVLLALVLR